VRIPSAPRAQRCWHRPSATTLPGRLIVSGLCRRAPEQHRNSGAKPWFMSSFIMTPNDHGNAGQSRSAFTTASWWVRAYILCFSSQTAAPSPGVRRRWPGIGARPGPHKGSGVEFGAVGIEIFKVVSPVDWDRDARIHRNSERQERASQRVDRRPIEMMSCPSRRRPRAVSGTRCRA
jgi:hypothetical protein